MAKEFTLEEAKAEITALKGQLETLANTPFELQEALAEIETLKSENAELKLLAEKGAKVAKAIPGTYKSKLHNKEIRFKDGMLKTAIDGKLVDSAEVIKNEGGKYTKVLDFFIEVGASVIEIVD